METALQVSSGLKKTVHDSRAELSVVFDLIARINSKMDLRSLLSTIMDAAEVLMDAEASSLMLLDRDTGELIITVPTGPSGSEIFGKKIPRGSGIAGWVAANGKPLLVNDVTKDDRFHGDLTDGDFKTRNVLCVPMVNSGGEVIGILEAINKKRSGHFEEVEITLFQMLANQAAISIEKERLIQEVIEKKRLEEQISLARAIQVRFWPEHAPGVSGIEIGALIEPAYEIGGDYYDILKSTTGLTGLVVGDVNGKGVPAALLMASIRASLRALFDTCSSPVEIINKLNRIIINDTDVDQYATLFFSTYNTSDRKLSYVNAGHIPPILFRKDTGTIERLKTGGPVIGFTDEITYRSGELHLQKGDVLVIFSDGIVEAVDENEIEFGEDNLIELIRQLAEKPSKEIAALISAAVAAYNHAGGHSDDETILVVKAV
ncbi:MAG: GAF domain-containing protein [Balneolaceae bacterium]|nr:MAG: GAF domain-containing protein [Balneolaceae bacterium]